MPMPVLYERPDEEVICWLPRMGIGMDKHRSTCNAGESLRGMGRGGAGGGALAEMGNCHWISGVITVVRLPLLLRGFWRGGGERGLN